MRVFFKKRDVTKNQQDAGQSTKKRDCPVMYSRILMLEHNILSIPAQN